MPRTNLATYVREQRVAKGYTIAELAAALSVHPNTVRNWEKEKHVIPSDKLIALNTLPRKVVARKPRHGPRKLT